MLGGGPLTRDTELNQSLDCVKENLQESVGNSADARRVGEQSSRENGATGTSDIEGRTARVAARERAASEFNTSGVPKSANRGTQKIEEFVQSSNKISQNTKFASDAFKSSFQL
jgi:hypothetical protein